MRFDLPTMDEIRGVGVQVAAGGPMQLSVDAIDEDPEQPRQEFDEESLVQLAATIAGRGVRQPVSVRKHPGRPGRWMLNFGARRLRAAKLAGETMIAAFEDDTADSYDQVIENEQREGLKPLEIALFIKRQLDRGQSRADIARGIGKSQPYVTYACSLVDPPDWLMDLYRCGKCRGMFELHELRRLHEGNAAGVDDALARVEHFGRVELKLLKARLATSRRMGEGTPAGAHAAVSAGPRLVTRRLQSGRQALDPAAGACAPSDEPEAAACSQACDVGVARQLVIRARHDGRTVSLVRDVLPELPASVFVTSGEGARSAVNIDDLDRLELLIEAVQR